MRYNLYKHVIYNTWFYVSFFMFGHTFSCLFDWIYLVKTPKQQNVKEELVKY